MHISKKERASTLPLSLAYPETDKYGGVSGVDTWCPRTFGKSGTCSHTNILKYLSPFSDIEKYCCMLLRLNKMLLKIVFGGWEYSLVTPFAGYTTEFSWPHWRHPLGNDRRCVVAMATGRSKYVAKVVQFWQQNERHGSLGIWMCCH